MRIRGGAHARGVWSTGEVATRKGKIARPCPKCDAKPYQPCASFRTSRSRDTPEAPARWVPMKTMHAER